MPTPPPMELRQADLSQLPLREMTPEQREELRRRYAEFLRHFGVDGRSAPPEPTPRAAVRKWLPGSRA